MRKIKEFDRVSLKDGREADVMETFENKVLKLPTLIWCVEP